MLRCELLSSRAVPSDPSIDKTFMQVDGPSNNLLASQVLAVIPRETKPIVRHNTPQLVEWSGLVDSVKLQVKRFIEPREFFNRTRAQLTLFSQKTDDAVRSVFIMSHGRDPGSRRLKHEPTDRNLCGVGDAKRSNDHTLTAVSLKPPFRL